jgi:putative transposase
LGLSAGPVPTRVEPATKAGLLDLVDHAVERGWDRRRACRLLHLDDRRELRWRTRRDLGGLDGLVDLRPGGTPLHGLLDHEREAILELFEAWGGIDRSHRKLAHRGSRLSLVHVSESTVRRVLADHGLLLPGTPAREPVEKKPWPDWLEWKPNRIWAYDFTHFTRAKRAAVAVLDMVSRKWIATLVSPEETSTQVEVCFLAALEAEALLEVVDARASEQLRQALWSGHPEQIETAIGAGQVPLLLAVSDNGPQMRSHSTREFLAGVHIAQHFGRPHTPTDQAWIETLFGHVKGEWPHLEKITDPGDLDAELDRVRADYNSVRLHASLGYVTPDDEHEGRGDAIRKARRDGLDRARQERLDHHRRSRGQSGEQP